MFSHFSHIRCDNEKCVKNNSGHVFFLEIFVPIDYLFVTLQPRLGLPLRVAGHSEVLSLTPRALRQGHVLVRGWSQRPVQIAQRRCRPPAAKLAQAPFDTKNNADSPTVPYRTRYAITIQSDGTRRKYNLHACGSI